MEWDEVVRLLDRYIWAQAHKFAPSMLSAEPCDLHQEGLMKLYEIHESGRYCGKSGTELAAIYRQIVTNTLWDMMKSSINRKSLNLALDLEAVSYSWGYDGFREVWLKYYQDFLGTKVSPEAARLLEELLNPSPAVYRMFNIQRMRRTALKNQGFDVRIPTRITNALIGKVLGFHPSKTKVLMAELQRVWRREMVYS